MLKSVHYHVLYGVGKEKTHLPVNAEILCVARQRGDVCLYYLFKGGETHQERVFFLARNDDLLPQVSEDADYKYIGTVPADDNYVAVHVFEILRGQYLVEP